MGVGVDHTYFMLGLTPAPPASAAAFAPPDSRRLCAGLKIVTHHHGGMLPFFASRFDTQRRNFNEGVMPPAASPVVSPDVETCAGL